jgi:hypothetical protein
VLGHSKPTDSAVACLELLAEPCIDSENNVESFSILAVTKRNAPSKGKTTAEKQDIPMPMPNFLCLDIGSLSEAFSSFCLFVPNGVWKLAVVRHNRCV